MILRETPKANPEKMLDIIHDAYNGKVVIPEFQRSFVWAREDIEEFLSSILQGYFIGTYLLLDTVPGKSCFPYRVVEGVNEINKKASVTDHTTVRMVLDGQQRITSLFYALYEPNIPLKYSKNPYRFFFIIENALDGDPTDAVVGISTADRRRMSEMETLVRESRAIHFSLMRDPGKFFNWFFKEQQFLKSTHDQDLIRSYYECFAHFLVPVVGLSHETDKENIVNIFERINRTGVSLSIFDLAVARLYLKGIKLRDLWKEFHTSSPGIDEVIKPEFLLKSIALIQGKEARKGSLLDVIDSLDKERFLQQWKIATKYILIAHKRMVQPQGGYGAYRKYLIPYTTLIVPLSVGLYHIEKRKGGEEMYRKLDSWYWANVFSQRYDSAVDSKSYLDVKELIEWFDTDKKPTWISNLSVAAINLNVEDLRSAVYRGLMCLIVRSGARDFISGVPASLSECHDDHIFPKSKYLKIKNNVNSILNRTLISEKSNIMKSDKIPSIFIPLFIDQHGKDIERFLQTLNSHLIPPEALQALLNDNFDDFIKLRQQSFQNAVRELIEN